MLTDICLHFYIEMYIKNATTNCSGRKLPILATNLGFNWKYKFQRPDAHGSLATHLRIHLKYHTHIHSDELTSTLSEEISNEIATLSPF